jgi:hypothetical protein
MSLIQREIDRIGETIRHSDPVPHYDELYAAQQALLWALEPETFKAPYDLLVPVSGDIPQGSEDCLGENDHSPSSSNPDCRVSEPLPRPTSLAR